MVSFPTLAKLDRAAEEVRKLAQAWTGEDPRQKHFEFVIGALDALSDAETAIFSYFESDWPTGAGNQLINAWGILRAFIILQDSVIELRGICDGVDYKKTRKAVADNFSALLKVRDFCDHFVGHPANRSWGDRPRAAATLNRHLPDRNIIKGLVRYTDRIGYKLDQLNVLEAVEVQAADLDEIFKPLKSWAS